MDVLVAAPDPDMRRFLLRALAALGHRSREEAVLRVPDALVVDAGPGVVVIRLPGGKARILSKPFPLEILQAALAPV